MHLSFRVGKYGRVEVEKRDGEALVAASARSFKSERDYRDSARELGVDRAVLLGAVDRFRRDGSDRLELEAPGPKFSVRVRGRREPAGSAQTFGDLRSALEARLECLEPLIEWEDADELCVVDVDGRLADPYGLGDAVLPVPMCLWSTHGGGLRLVYAAAAGYSAQDCAGVAGLAVAARLGAARLELKTRTRHPLYHRADGGACGPVVWRVQSAEMGRVAAWLRAERPSDEDVDAWLNDRGMEQGGRYGHEQCPFAPNLRAERQPVVVRDDGIFCHRCAAAGRGFASWAHLIGARLPSGLLRAVSGLVHWEHARFVVERHVGLQGDVAMAAYSAALKLLHGPEDPRCKAAMRAGRNFVRLERRWATLQGETYTRDPSPILASLPACQYVADGEARVSPEMVSRFSQPIDLSREGYVALAPVWGMRVYSHRLQLRRQDAIPIVMHSSELAAECMEEFRPRYVAERDEEASWRVLEAIFPGLSRALVRLLVAARGCSEGEVGMPPMIFISGPTSAAKSSTVVLAAAVCGDSNHSVVWSSALDRVRQSLLEAKQSGSFVTFNEILKDGKSAGQSLLQTMDFLLNLTPDSLSHKLYVGPVELGGLPVCVWTDTSVPAELKQDAQLARRLVHAHLPRQVDWASSLRTHGLSQIRSTRSLSQEVASACDTVLSAVIDEFFSSPLTFEEIAASLGFKTLAQSSEAAESVTALVALFAAAVSSTGDARHVTGRGWRVVSRDVECPLHDAWRLVCDDCFVSSRRCSEVDWRKLVGGVCDILFECRPLGQHRVALRFVSPDKEKVNGELVLEAGVAGLRGPGDAVGCGPEGGWCEGLPG